MSQNTVQTDAKEFGLHVKQGGWRLGLLVARNVEKGTRGGDNGNQHTGGISQSRNGKVPAKKFADDSGTSADRVLRYLTAWNKAADAGHVPHSSDLTPGTEVALDVETLPDWRAFYVGTPEARPDRITNEDRDEALARLADVQLRPAETPGDFVGTNARAISEVASSDYQMGILAGSSDVQRFVRRAIEANPNAAKAARDALDKVYEDAPKPYADTMRRPAIDEALDLIEEFRRLHKGVDHIVQLVNSGRARVTNPDAVLREIAWLRTALGYIEDGVKSDDLAAQIENFLAEVG